MSERALHAAEKTNFRNFPPIINQETVLGGPVVPKYLREVSSSYSKYAPRKIEESEFSVFLAANNACSDILCGNHSNFVKNLFRKIILLVLLENYLSFP